MKKWHLQLCLLAVSRLVFADIVLVNHGAKQFAVLFIDSDKQVHVRHCDSLPKTTSLKRECRRIEDDGLIPYERFYDGLVSDLKLANEDRSHDSLETISIETEKLSRQLLDDEILDESKLKTQLAEKHHMQSILLNLKLLWNALGDAEFRVESTETNPALQRIYKALVNASGAFASFSLNSHSVLKFCNREGEEISQRTDLMAGSRLWPKHTLKVQPQWGGGTVIRGEQVGDYGFKKYYLSYTLATRPHSEATIRPEDPLTLVKAIDSDASKICEGIKVQRCAELVMVLKAKNGQYICATGAFFYMPLFVEFTTLSKYALSDFFRIQ